MDFNLFLGAFLGAGYSSYEEHRKDGCTVSNKKQCLYIIFSFIISLFCGIEVTGLIIDIYPRANNITLLISLVVSSVTVNIFLAIQSIQWGSLLGSMVNNFINKVSK